MVEEASNVSDVQAGRGQARAMPGGELRRRFARANNKLQARNIAAANAPGVPQQDDPNKVVQVVRWMEQEGAKARARRVEPWLLVSLLAVILLPTIVAGLYYTTIAADQYQSEARFAIRSNESQGADVLGMISGMPRATVISDSYIVADYVRSAEMVAELERRLPLRGVYAHEQADFLTRFDPAASREKLLGYWNRRVDVGYDATKNTLTVAVRAFAPGDAERIVTEIVDITRTLINNLSAQSRRDAVQFAATEVARAELRVRAARADMLKFRTEHNDFDPAQTAAASLDLVAKLESERSDLNSQLAAVSGYLSDSAPSVQMLKARIQAVQDEIDRKHGEFSSADGSSSEGARSKDGALASVVANYQDLVMSQEFAETAYKTALASMERARTEADRTHSYLAMYMHPSAAESAAYPRPVFNTFIVFIFACVIWAIGCLGWLTIRDHLT